MTADEPPLPRRPTLRTEAVRVARSFVRFGPSHGPRWPLALQAGLAMAIPVVALSAFGRDDLALLAASGAFPILYGGWLTPRERAAFVPFIAIAMLGSAALGVLIAPTGLVGAILGLVAITVAASALCFGWGVGPPGPLFFVLVFGLAAHLTTVVDGHRLVDPVAYLGVAAGASALAYMIAMTPLLRARHRRATPRRLSDLFPGPRWTPDARVLLLRAVVVAFVGAGVAALIDPERAYWVVSGGIAVIGVRVSRRIAVTRGIHRAVGTIVGGGVYLALATMSLPGVVLGLVLGTLQFAIELVIVRHYALALAFITPLVLLIIGSASAGAGGVELAIERVVDTVAGAVLGVLCGLIVLKDRRA